MKRIFVSLSFVFAAVFFAADANAQCSVCTRTAEQMGEKPAGKINAGILYLAGTPLVLAGVIGYRWWRKNN